MQNRKNHEGSGLTGLDLLKANLQLGTMKAALVVPTQWLQVIMRVMQASLLSKTNPELLTMRGAVKRIIAAEKPTSIREYIKPFFRGTTAGASKELIKGVVYKGALIKGAPSLAENYVLNPLGAGEHVSATQYYIMRALVAGGIASSADVALGGILESAATHRATSHGADAKSNFFKEVKAQGSLKDALNRAYRGAGATMVKGSIAFSTLFLTEKPIEHWVVKKFDVKNPRQMPWDAAITNALLGGVAVAVTSAPFDIVKTQAQMPNPSKLSVVQGLSHNYQKYGIRGITAGIIPKSIMITLGWGVTKLALSVNEMVGREESETPRQRM